MEERTISRLAARISARLASVVFAISAISAKVRSPVKNRGGTTGVTTVELG